MKHSLMLVCALAISRLISAAQTFNEVEITAEPHHHLTLQNKYVRVFKVEVAPHEATLMHRHRHDYAYVTIGPADVSNEVKGKPAVEVKLQDGETEFTPADFAHIARNLANTPFRNVTIEFLQTGQAVQSTKWADDRGLQILNAGTKDILFVRHGVRAADVQLNPGGSAPNGDHVRADLIVAVSEIELQNGPAGTRYHHIHLKPGDFQWLDTARTLVNAGRQPARFLIFEFR